MSLHDAIDRLNSVFFDADGFAESVTYIPQGFEAESFSINAIVDWGDEEGNNQVRGEGRSTLNQDRGRSVRSSAIVELPTTRVVDGVTVRMLVNENGRDRILVTKPGDATPTRLSVKRVIARDGSAMSVLCNHETEYAAQNRTTRFG